jgi:hypothetical protein
MDGCYQVSSSSCHHVLGLMVHSRFAPTTFGLSGAGSVSPSAIPHGEPAYRCYFVARTQYFAPSGRWARMPSVLRRMPGVSGNRKVSAPQPACGSPRSKPDPPPSGRSAVTLDQHQEARRFVSRYRTPTIRTTGFRILHPGRLAANSAAPARIALLESSVVFVRSTTGALRDDFVIISSLQVPGEIPPRRGDGRRI